MTLAVKKANVPIPKYYPQVFVVKALLKNGDRFALMKEPPTASWKPGRWGLPGGKVDPGETWLEALSRELMEEVGEELELEAITPTGIAVIEEIVFFNPKIDADQITHHVIIECEYRVESAPVDLANLKWLPLTELQKLPLNELTEYYFPNLWTRLSNPKYQAVPMDLFQIWKVKDLPDFMSWFSAK